MCDKLRIEKNLLQRATQSKLQLSGHICRMEDNRKLKTLMFGITDGMNKRGRPRREWMDNIVSWCKTGLQELNSLAQDHRRWKPITRQAMDTNRRYWQHNYDVKVLSYCTNSCTISQLSKVKVKRYRKMTSGTSSHRSNMCLTCKLSLLTSVLT